MLLGDVDFRNWICAQNEEFWERLFEDQPGEILSRISAMGPPKDDEMPTSKGQEDHDQETLIHSKGNGAQSAAPNSVFGSRVSINQTLHDHKSFLPHCTSSNASNSLPKVDEQETLHSLEPQLFNLPSHAHKSFHQDSRPKLVEQESPGLESGYKHSRETG
jgi:hypothetical protein